MTTTPTVWKAQHQINFTDSGDQGDPEIVVIGNGRYVVVWTEPFYNNPAGPIAPEYGSDIVGQIFDANGNRIGNEFRVNYTFFGDNEDNASVAALPNGGFVVVYQDTDADGTSIRAQRYDVDGNLLPGGPTTIRLTANDPAVAVRPDGRFLVALDDGSNGPDFRKVDTNGVIQSPPFDSIYVFGGTTNTAHPDVAALPDGNYVAAFEANNAIVYYMVPADSWPELHPRYIQASSASDVHLAALMGGGFVAVWTQTGGDGDGLGIGARLFDNWGGALGEPWPVSVLNAEGDQDQPDVIALKDGGFVVIWRNELTSDVRGQRFDAAGNFVGTEFIAGSDNGSETNPTVALLSDGRFIVGFQRPSGDHDIIATIFDPREATINGNNSNDTIVGPIGGGTVNGMGGNDTLQGSAGQDNLNGGTGNDTLIGGSGAGNDRYDGGTGIDTIVFASATQPVAVNLSAVSNQAVGAQTGIDQITNVENVIGGSGDDRIVGNAVVNRLEGGPGDDVYLVGAGDKVLEKAGQGFDTVITGTSYKLPAGSAVELLRTPGASTTKAINLIGNELINRLTGNAAANALDGGGGADIMAGGRGNDIYRVDNTLDKVFEQPGQGTDTVIAGVSYTLLTGHSVELLRTAVLTAKTAINLTGNNLANTLQGNAGANKLNGGIGADTLAGGAGKDTLTGGGSKDRFDFNTAAEIGNGATRDVITDFVHRIDTIDLSTIDANGTGAGHAFSFLASHGASFSGVVGQLRWFRQDAANTANDRTIVEGDINGDRVADFQLQLTGLKSLTAADFVL